MRIMRVRNLRKLKKPVFHRWSNSGECFGTGYSELEMTAYRMEQLATNPRPVFVKDLGDRYVVAENLDTLEAYI